MNRKLLQKTLALKQKAKRFNAAQQKTDSSMRKAVILGQTVDINIRKAPWYTKPNALKQS